MRSRTEPQPGALVATFGCAVLTGLLVDWTQRSWHIAAAICAVGVAALAWTLFARSVDMPRQMVLMIPIGGWGFLQIWLHSTVAPNMTLHGSVVWAMCAVTFFLASQILRDGRSRRMFLEWSVWVATGLVLLAILQFYTSPGRVFWYFPAADTVIGTFKYKNQFAAFIELMAPVALWQAYRGKRLSGALCYATMLAGTLTSRSRMGIIVIVAESVVFLCLVGLRRGRSERPLRSAIATALIIIVVVSGASIIAGTDQTLSRFQEPHIYRVRHDMSVAALKMAEERPVSGFGIGTWLVAYPKFATFDLALIVNEAHNDWFQWAAEGGFPFMLLMAALVLWLAGPACQSLWGLGLLAVMAHSSTDYLIREPAIGFAWFAMAGALSRYSGSREDGA